MCLLSLYELHNQNFNKIGSTLQTYDKKQQNWVSTATLEIGVLSEYEIAQPKSELNWIHTRSMY